MSRLLLDTNVIVRFLTGDHPAHSPRSRKLFTRAAAGDVTLVVTDLALAETAWVLQSFYSLDRDAITAALKDLIESTGIEVQNKAILLSALRNFPVDKESAPHFQRSAFVSRSEFATQLQ